MKKKYILSALALAVIGLFAFQKANTDNGVIQHFTNSFMFSSGGQSGLTGAPSEQNCTQCHTGSTQDGTTQNVFTLIDGSLNSTTSYIPGSSYTASIQLSSNPTKKGFSSVVLDGTDSNAGSFVGSGVGGTQNFSASGRDYVSHTTVSNTNSSWAWTWNAPATSVGDVIFYIASNEANNNGSTSGDVIYLSQHIISDATASIVESPNKTSFIAGYNATSNFLSINFTYLGIGNMFMNIVDLNGRSVFTFDLGQSEIGDNKEHIMLPVGIKSGMYVVHFFVGNKAMSSNILITK